MKTSATTTQNDFLLFEGFIDYLNQQGFVIGIDTHVRVKRLMAKLDEKSYSAQRLKYLLCPLFASDQEQQAQFYQAFDYYFGADGLQFGKNHPEKQTNKDSQLILTKKTPKWWYVLGSLLLFSLLLTGIIFLWLPTNTEGQSALLEHYEWNNEFDNIDTTAVSYRDLLNIEASSPGDFAEVDSLQLSKGLPSAQKSTWEKWLPYIKWGIISLLCLLFLYFEWKRYKQRKLFLNHQKLRIDKPNKKPLVVEKQNAPLYTPQALQQPAQMMRRRQRAEGKVLDINQTINATVASQGYPTFKYRSTSRPPEYLILIDQHNTNDHLATLFDKLMTELASQDIFITTYFYNKNPRICWQSTEGNQFYLESLYYKYAYHRLIIVGDGEYFFNDEGDLAEWTLFLDLWKEKAMLSTRPTGSWDEREQVIASQLHILPASLTSITLLIEQFEQETTPNIAYWISKNYLFWQPEMDPNFQNVPELSADAYDKNSLVGLRNRLKNYLGNDAFQWLCACAVYPEIQWDLTLFLGKELSTEAQPLMTNNNLIKLSKLEWFRKGHIPEDIRRFLAAELDKEKQKIIYQNITTFLQKAAGLKEEDANVFHQLKLIVLHPLKRTKNLFIRLWKRKLLPLPKAYKGVWLQSIESIRNNLFGLQLPRFLQKFFYRSNLPLMGLKTGMRLCGLIAIIALLQWTMTPSEQTEEEVHADLKYAEELFMQNQFTKSFDLLYGYSDNEYFTPYANYLLGEILFHGYGYQEKDPVTAAEFYQKAAEQGVGEAMVYMGFMKEKGLDGDSDNINIAEAWYAKARQKLLETEAQKRATASSMLGMMSKAGYGVPTDFEEAMKWFGKAGNMGYSPAQNQMGSLHLRNAQANENQQDYQDAFQWFSKAAKNGYAPAQNHLAYMYSKGFGTEKTDYRKAIEWYVKALQQGNTKAKKELDHLFRRVLKLSGYGKETLRWYMEIAQMGYAPAQNTLGYIYDNGIGLDQDDAKAVNWYRKAAEQGYIMAQNNLGYMYRNGKGVKADEAEAFKWYKASAEQGYPPAQNNLGFMYDQGIGTSEDNQKAVKWYLNAAEQGNIDAAYNIGTMLRYGSGIDMDKEAAVIWYQKAARKGYAMAQYELGYMYERGIGIETNFTYARQWYVLAAGKNHDPAKKALQRLNNSFFEEDEEQLKELEKMLERVKER